MNLDSEANAYGTILITPCTLLLENTGSTARDHLANERTFLSWLRLSVTLSIVSLAIVVSFHLRDVPSQLEKQMAVPLGIVFWMLAMLTLVSGTASYASTVKGYAARRPVVETGPNIIVMFCVIAAAIFAVCILFISTGAVEKRTGTENS